MRKVEQNIDEVLHKIANQAQEYFSSIPVIVLGSGASAAHGLPGMGRLAEYLITEITPNLQYKELWGKFVKLLNDGVDLESALQKTTLPEEITKEIIIKTFVKSSFPKTTRLSTPENNIHTTKSSIPKKTIKDLTTEITLHFCLLSVLTVVA